MLKITIKCSKCNKDNHCTFEGERAADHITCSYCGEVVARSNPEAGYVYILSNKKMPGLYKIGMTTRSIKERVEELNSQTGVPFNFEVEMYIVSDDPLQDESTIHLALNENRVNNKEYFEADIQEICGVARQIFSEDRIVIVNNDIILSASGKKNYGIMDGFPTTEITVTSSEIKNGHMYLYHDCKDGYAYKKIKLSDFDELLDRMNQLSTFELTKRLDYSHYFLKCLKCHAVSRFNMHTLVTEWYAKCPACNNKELVEKKQNVNDGSSNGALVLGKCLVCGRLFPIIFQNKQEVNEARSRDRCDKCITKDLIDKAKQFQEFQKMSILSRLKSFFFP